MSESFYLFVFVGFVAQFIKGSIGMGFGVISSAFLLSLGIPPVSVSSSVHTASIATTAASGVSHVFFKNVDMVLFRRLLVPGVMGSVLGVSVLTRIPLTIARPVVAIYLLFIGLIIVFKALRRNVLEKPRENMPSEHVHGVMPLAVVGGFFNAIGGGGWGNIITSALLVQGAVPHYVIGTVNSVQFFIAVSASVTFFFTVGIAHGSVIVGLMLGGVIAAPMAAFMVRRINPRLLMIAAGMMVALLSLWTFSCLTA